MVAALLAVIPALGHAYLRRWDRAVAWFTLIVGSVLAVGAFGEFSGSVAVGSVSIRLVVPAVTLTGLSAVDAFLIASRGTDEGPTCPHCGKQQDEALAFCWYCAVRLDEE